MSKIIQSPLIGSVVKHTGWGFESNKNYPCDVYIESGDYEVDGRVSNYWSWRRVLKDGSLAPTESGYGSFRKTEIKYKVSINVERTNS